MIYYDMKNCPVCGIAAQDGIDDQIALWGFGIHDAKTNSYKRIDDKVDDMRILHKHCLLAYFDGAFIDCRVEAKKDD